MTENGSWSGEHYLASDVWGIEKAMETMTPEEELAAWRTTSGMLNHLCAMADDLLLEPLILALADALGRAREGERRAEDRLSRLEGAELGSRARRSASWACCAAATPSAWASTPTSRTPTTPPSRGRRSSASSARSTGRRTSSSCATGPRSGSPTPPSRKNAPGPA